MRLSGEITGLDDEGRGVLRHEGIDVHVGGALPGDRVDAQLEHRSPHKPEAWARLLSITQASALRAPPCCPATGRCGGCPLGAMKYEAQLAYKQERIVRAIAAVAGAPAPEAIVPSPSPLGYRSVSKLVYGLIHEPGDHRACLGGYLPRSHDLVDLAGCTVTEPVLETLRAQLLEALVAERVAPYDEQTHAGVLSYVVLRCNAAGEALVTLVGPELDPLEALAARLPAPPALVGLAGNRRPLGNAIFGAETRVLRGAGELSDEVGPARLFLSPTAFFQVNRAISARIYADVADALADRLEGPLADVYCGVGGIALTLAARGATDLVGVEVNAAAVRDAERAAAGVTGLRFVAADAAVGLRALGPRTAVVVNPPRRGLDAAMRSALVAATPERIAYISCDPASLARDLAMLAPQGFAMTRITPYDMHPQTAHIETLAILDRRR